METKEEMERVRPQSTLTETTQQSRVEGKRERKGGVPGVNRDQALMRKEDPASCGEYNLPHSSRNSQETQPGYLQREASGRAAGESY